MSFLKNVAKAAVVNAIDNNLASKQRSRNIPKDAELFSKERTEVSAESSGSEEVYDWRVRIEFDPSLLGGPSGFISALSEFENNEVLFPYQPSMTISTTANYTGIDPVHSNYVIQTYKSSQVNDISITGLFTAEYEEDAKYWIAATTFFKAATKMSFGKSINPGQPPIVCKLKGYGPGIIPHGGVPVVIKDFSVSLPSDVNYIKCNIPDESNPTWVPIRSEISVTVTPIYSREKIRQFSLQDYASGNLKGGFL